MLIWTQQIKHQVREKRLSSRSDFTVEPEPRQTNKLKKLKGKRETLNTETHVFWVHETPRQRGTISTRRLDPFLPNRSEARSKAGVRQRSEVKGQGL